MMQKWMMAPGEFVGDRNVCLVCSGVSGVVKMTMYKELTTDLVRVTTGKGIADI